MALAARSPGSRKSLSLSEHNLNLDMDHVTLPVTNRQLKAKKRVVASIGGEGLNGVAFNLGKGKEMSPRRAARRSMVGCLLPLIFIDLTHEAGYSNHGSRS
jgi:hypothetical protein